MRDLDALRTALRDESAALPAAPLLPAVRSGARDLQRRRLAGVAAALVVLLGVVSGVGCLGLSRSGRTLPAGPVKPDLDPADLVGPTWYLLSWTTAAGAVARPSTDSAPTLIFDSTTAAHSANPANTTTWIMRLRQGTLVGREGPTTAASESPASVAVNAAMAAVLDGPATWEITEGELAIRSRSGSSLTYSRSPASAAATAAGSALADNFFTVIGRTWALTSVTRDGHAWDPSMPTPATLRIWSGGEAQIDDGSNNAEWSVQQSGSSLTWKKIWSTGVGTTAATRKVDLAVAAILTGRTTWAVAGNVLTIRRPDGDNLIFGSDGRTPVVGHAAVSLSSVHGCGLQVCGRGLVTGDVTIENERGIVVWRMTVTTHDGGNDVVQAGTYAVRATIADGVCKAGTVTVVVGRSTPVTLSCRDGLSTG